MDTNKIDEVISEAKTPELFVHALFYSGYFFTRTERIKLIQAYDAAIRAEYEADINFLLKRSFQAGGMTFGGERDVGMSSNSIVAIAYGLTPLEKQVLPFDISDLRACLNMWKKLPEHRKTGDAVKALEKARTAIEG